MGTDVGEEGVQVEAAEVGGKGEENVVERKEGTTAEGKQGTAAEGKGDMKAGGSQPLPENVLAKDW